jgi:hypothetical protein
VAVVRSGGQRSDGVCEKKQHNQLEEKLGQQQWKQESKAEAQQSWKQNNREEDGVTQTYGPTNFFNINQKSNLWWIDLFQTLAFKLKTIWRKIPGDGI